MSKPIVECIANFSEGRRPEVIDAIKEVITSIPNVNLLDQHSDKDHNRSVLTFVGPPEEIEEAAFLAIGKAAELIDMEQHRGEHPRIGASDVVPFVPISGVSMKDCIKIADSLGRRVGDQLNIPVYLYEEAAKTPERKFLEHIRHGEYELLKEEIATKAARAPDYGPKKLGSAGATVIGARQPLIAFNVYLNSKDISIAKKIARAVRHSTGGLRYVKGLGLEVDNLAQVSMNLTNFRGTPIARVVELIRREALQYGVNIHHSELVGLIPQEALIDTAKYYIQLDHLDTAQILENKLAQVQEAISEKKLVTTPPPYGFLEALAAGTPAPGGGSAAAFSGAAGVALVEMVARLTIGKKKYADVEKQMLNILEEAENLRTTLTMAIERDAQAFTAVLNAYMLPKDNAEERDERKKAISEATLKAAEVPLEVANTAFEVIELALQVVTFGNLNAISDGATGATLARAAMTGAGYNVRINLSGLDEPEQGESMLSELIDLEKRAEIVEADIRTKLIERGKIPLP